MTAPTTPLASPTALVRRSAGVHTTRAPVADTDRFAPDPRYPAMFPTSAGRLVWDGHALHLARPDGARWSLARIPPDGDAHPHTRVDVTVTSAATTARFTTTAPRPQTRSGAVGRVGEIVATLAPASARRFARFAGALATAHPDVWHVDDRTVPAPRTPRLHPDAVGTRRRPGVFTRAVWRLRQAAERATDERPAADVVDQLERLADLHERGALTDGEYRAAKARTLGR